MANNGRASFIENSKNIHIHHLFLKDRAYKGKIEVNFYPYHLMISDYITKPLQGKMIKKFVI